MLASESLVAAWESGRRIPKPQYIDEVVRTLDIDPMLARMIAELVSNVPPEWLGRLMEIEAAATSLYTYDPLLVPGLLQVESYVRELIANSGRPNLDADELVSARLERQKILVGENPPMLVAVMDEGVLRRPVGGAAVMREQLTHLLEVVQGPDVAIQILPQSVGAHPGLAGAFVVVGFDGREIEPISSSAGAAAGHGLIAG